MNDAQFFIAKPEAIPGKTITVEGCGTFAAYITVDGHELKWSAKFPLPELFDRVTITMNGIGRAVVEGYFSEHGYLGLMTRALRPPKWLRDQRKREEKKDPRWHSRPQWYKNHIGCEFGAEIALPKKAPRKPRRNVRIECVETGHCEVMTIQQFSNRFGKLEGKEILAGHDCSIVALRTDEPVGVLPNFLNK